MVPLLECAFLRPAGILVDLPNGAEVVGEVSDAGNHAVIWRAPLFGADVTVGDRVRSIQLAPIPVRRRITNAAIHGAPVSAAQQSASPPWGRQVKKIRLAELDAFSVKHPALRRGTASFEFPPRRLWRRKACIFRVSLSGGFSVRSIFRRPF